MFREFVYDHVNDDVKVARTTDSQGIMVSFYSFKNYSWAQAETLSTLLLE